ncbi:MAG: DUF354 domain-containing protein [Promethearchaeota archaeon]
MRILIDIGHPAQVHLFKHFISEIEKKGHKVALTARDKDVVINLLKAYKIPFRNLGKYHGTLGKVTSLVNFNIKLFGISKKFKPDLFISSGSIHATQTSTLLRKYSIIFLDTEHHSVPQFQNLVGRFTDVIYTPSCFEKNLGSNHRRYNGYHELAYLHPQYFKSNGDILEKIGLSKDEKIILVRHVAWNAQHDIGQSGLRRDDKDFLKKLEDYGTVILTSEKQVPRYYRKYVYIFPPEEMHNILYYSSLYIGEGATMTTESALLGTPAIYVNSIKCGTINELAKFGLVKKFHKYSANEILEVAIDILEDPSSKKNAQKKSKQLIKQKINVTQFMVQEVEKIAKLIN